MNLDDYIEGTFDPNNPTNKEDRPDEEIAINESYYDELIDNSNQFQRVKILFREYFILKNHSLEKTAKEKSKIAELENKIKQTLKLK